MSVEGSPDALGGGGRHVSHWAGWYLVCKSKTACSPDRRA